MVIVSRSQGDALFLECWGTEQTGQLVAGIACQSVVPGIPDHSSRLHNAQFQETIAARLSRENPEKEKESLIGNLAKGIVDQYRPRPGA